MFNSDLIYFYSDAVLIFSRNMNILASHVSVTFVCDKVLQFYKLEREQEKYVQF